eukprot:TRINITY_DN12365_c0_g1_i1.p1 TRINITY_DN12365_c0_g1~~TRINITY_DN12365_c0_g1_i1.p1  ORF type:complete len:160 (+),score=25.73 TRINITY_DN12365_c0_g1_i1:136-615(+)
MIEGIINSYQGLKEFSKAQEYAFKLEEIQQNMKGEKSEEYAQILTKIGDLYNDQDDFDKALQFFERSRGILQELYGENHPKFAISLNKLAWAYFNKSEFDLAYEFNSKAMGILQVNNNGLSQTDVEKLEELAVLLSTVCLLYTSPSPRDRQKSRMPSSA